MSAPRRRRGAGEAGPYLAVAGLLTLIVLATGIWLAATAGAAITGRARPMANPFGFLIALAAGKAQWPGIAADIFAAAEAAALAAAAAAVWRAAHRLRSPRTRVDAAASFLARRRDLEAFTARGAAAAAARLGAQATSPGVLVGRIVGTGQLLYGTWEDVQIDVWGPRTGKTTSRAIPAIMDAPGAVVATSNKRDIVDATRMPREAAGPVRVFDPQNVAGEQPSWWWNPLSYVSGADHMWRVDRAAKLAAVFTAFSRDRDAKTDAYFDPEGEALLGFMLLAAAEGRRPITEVFRWLSDQLDTEPADILHRCGHDLAARAVDGVMRLADKQRDGIYGTARKAVNILASPAISRWVTPNPARPRAEFTPAGFATSGGTLYLLSREEDGGNRTAAPLVTALTIATVEAAEEQAAASPGGRLAVPMLCVLDEAANVCRWRNLPNLYSHYGSRGIVLMTILQSWSQGVEVWGEHGMAKLWSAANIRVYGGGVSDTRFLGDLAQLVGDFEPATTSLSVQRGQGSSRSVTTSTRPERILDIADLAAMPRGRALVLPSGSPPVLVQTMPWSDGPYADAIRESIAACTPKPGPAPASTR